MNKLTETQRKFITKYLVTDFPVFELQGARAMA